MAKKGKTTHKGPRKPSGRSGKAAKKQPEELCRSRDLPRHNRRYRQKRGPKEGRYLGWKGVIQTKRHLPRWYWKKR